MFFSEKFYIETSFLSSLGGAATQRASSGAQEGAKRAATNSVMGVSLQVCWSEFWSCIVSDAGKGRWRGCLVVKPLTKHTCIETAAEQPASEVLM